MPNNGGVYSNIEHGNPLLKPEDSRTWTLGVVWQAQERNLTISADWYDILIEEAVGNLNFQTAYRQCFNYTGVENPTYAVQTIQYCEFIHRNPETAESAFVEAVNFNLGLDLHDRRRLGCELAAGDARRAIRRSVFAKSPYRVEVFRRAGLADIRVCRLDGPRRPLRLAGFHDVFLPRPSD